MMISTRAVVPASTLKRPAICSATGTCRWVFSPPEQKGKTAMTLLLPCRQDPVVGLLKRQFPYADILKTPDKLTQPLTVMIDGDGLDGGERPLRLGMLDTLLKQPIPSSIAALKQDVSPLPAFSTEKSTAVDKDFGLNLLGRMIGALGGPEVEIKAELQNAQKIVFSFANVQERLITIASLGKALWDACVDLNNVDLEQYFGPHADGDYAFLVVYSIIVSDQFSITVEQAAGGGAQIDIRAIDQLFPEVGGGIHVNTKVANVISFTGPTPLTFACNFRRYKLTESGKFEAYHPTASELDEDGGLAWGEGAREDAPGVGRGARPPIASPLTKRRSVHRAKSTPYSVSKKVSEKHWSMISVASPPRR
jgi:hypothetical protein